MKSAVFLPLVLIITLCCKPRNGPNSDIGKVDDNSQLLRKSDSLLAMAERKRIAGVIDSALLLYKSGIKIKERALDNDPQLWKLYYKVGAMYHGIFNYEASSGYLHQAKFLADIGGVSSDTIVDINFKLAECRSNMKDFALAVSLLKNNLNVIEANFPDSVHLKTTAYGLLSGTYYNSNKFEESISWSKKAILMTSRDDHQNRAKYYTLMGMAMRELQQYDEALRSFNAAIRHDLMWTSSDSENIATRYIFKASVFIANGMSDSALYYYRENLRIRKEIYGDKHVNTFGSKYSIGQWFEKSGDYDSAAYYYHSSLNSLIRTFNASALECNPKPYGDEVTINLIIGLVGKAASLKKMFEKDTTQQKRLELSLKTFLLADSVFNDYRKNFIDDDPQLAQLESGYIPYHEMVDAAFRLNRVQEKEFYLEHALRIMERSRAVVLQNSLRRAEAYGKAGIPETYRHRENTLLSEKENILQQISRLPSSGQTDSLRAALLGINDRHQKLLKEIERINPRYFSLKYDNAPLELKNVQEFLRDRNSVLFDFLWGGNKLYVLYVGDEYVKSKIIHLDNALITALESVQRELTSETKTIYDKDRFNAFCVNSNLMYRVLIGDMLSSSGQFLPKIIISADGRLHSFPFEALITENPTGEVVNYKLPYALYRHEFSYAFSIGNLMMASQDGFAKKNLIAFGYSSNGETGLTDGLPGSEKEINFIRKIFPDASGEFYLGSSASESVFKEQIADFDIVHLAIHGVSDDSDAQDSHLIFRTDADSINDGNLYAHELYDLNLSNLNLAVLSSCETGIGKYHVGEGALSIARGFAYSGCPTQVISLWKVNDQATSQMMESFYTNLTEGKTIGESLTRARIDYLARANELSSHPAFWAAFIQMGDSNSRFTNDWKYWGIGSVVIVLLILVAVFYKKHFKKMSMEKSRSHFDRTIV